MAGERGANRVAGDRVPDPHRLILSAGDDDLPGSGPPDSHCVHFAAWPRSGARTGSPVTASQIRTVSSSEPETMISRSPARPIATPRTGAPWPTSGAPTGSPVTASQIRIVASAEPETMISGSGPPNSDRVHRVLVTGQPSVPAGPADAAQRTGHSLPAMTHAALSVAARTRASYRRPGGPGGPTE